MKSTILFMLSIILLMAGCGPTVQYIGTNYPPSNNVDVFLNSADIKKSYTVMGKITGESVLLESFSDIQAKIVSEAKKRGADAVLIYNMEEKIVGTTSTTDATVSGGEHKHWWSADASSTTETSNQLQKVLHADFLKYK